MIVFLKKLLLYLKQISEKGLNKSSKFTHFKICHYHSFTPLGHHDNTLLGQKLFDYYHAPQNRAAASETFSFLIIVLYRPLLSIL